MSKKNNIARLPSSRPASLDTLDDLLDTYSVGDVDECHQEANPECTPPLGWFWVCNDDGVIAYFASESDAYRFRLAEINRRLNS